MYGMHHITHQAPTLFTHMEHSRKALTKYHTRVAMCACILPYEQPHVLDFPLLAARLQPVSTHMPSPPDSSYAVQPLMPVYEVPYASNLMSYNAAHVQPASRPV